MLASAYRESLWDRMLGAAQLDESIYLDLKLDRSATGQAALVVILAAVATGMRGLPDGSLGLLLGFVAGLLGWAASAYVAHRVAVRWFKAEATAATRLELLRTLGFASSPRLLLVLGALPLLGGLITLLVLVWTLGTMAVAIRQTFDFDIWRAMATASAGWIVLFLVLLLASAIT